MLIHVSICESKWSALSVAHTPSCPHSLVAQPFSSVAQALVHIAKPSIKNASMQQYLGIELCTNLSNVLVQQGPFQYLYGHQEIFFEILKDSVFVCEMVCEHKAPVSSDVFFTLFVSFITIVRRGVLSIKLLELMTSIDAAGVPYTTCCLGYNITCATVTLDGDDVAIGPYKTLNFMNKWVVESTHIATVYMCTNAYESRYFVEADLAVRDDYVRDLRDLRTAMVQTCSWLQPIDTSNVAQLQIRQWVKGLKKGGLGLMSFDASSPPRNGPKPSPPRLVRIKHSDSPGYSSRLERTSPSKKRRMVAAIARCLLEEL